jgi:hypothetical protein
MALLNPLSAPRHAEGKLTEVHRLLQEVVYPKGGRPASGRDRKRQVNRGGGIAEGAAKVLTALINAVNISRGLEGTEEALTLRHLLARK